jgi:hypothetical protein
VLAKKCWIAQIWAIAKNYFKYKMIGDRTLPDGLDIGVEPFIPQTGDDGNVS